MHVALQMRVGVHVCTCVNLYVRVGTYIHHARQHGIPMEVEGRYKEEHMEVEGKSVGDEVSHMEVQKTINKNKNKEEKQQ
jgi:hypothetical protein